MSVAVGSGLVGIMVGTWNMNLERAPNVRHADFA